MIIVRNYGLLPPDNWADDCHEQLFLMNKFWNQLVEIERADRARYREILLENQEVAELEARLAEVSGQILELSTERKKLRAAKRSKNIDDGLLVEHIKSLRESERAIKIQLKELRAKAREASKPALDALNAARKEAVKLARNQSGLWWGNYNAVCESYETARAKAMKIGVDLRFKRFDGSGRFVNQIQGGMDVNDFMTGRHTVTWIDPELKPIPGRLGKPCPRLHITAFTGRDENGKHTRRILTFPIILHRPIPETENDQPVRIKTLQVTKKRITAGHYQWSVTITATTDASTPLSTSAVAVGINLGWKREGRNLRVATIYDSNGDSQHYWLPAKWTDDMDYAETLRSDIDEVTNALFAALLALPADTEGLALSVVEGIKKAKHPHSGLIARFARELQIRPLIKAHLITKNNVLESIAKLPALEALPCYLAWAKAKEREFCGLRRHLLGQRKDLYRKIASEIACRYSVIAIDNADYAKMARLESKSGEENDLLKIARTNRFRVSPSELRLAIEQAVSKRGGIIERISQQNECAVCGRPDKQDTIIWQCGHCGAVYDQDENMAKLLIRNYLPEVRDSGKKQA
jgi:hypothetical protein